LTSDNFNWLVEEVGKGTKPAIAIAPDGTPNIAFMFESQDGFVKAGARIDGAWDISTVADGYYYGPLDIAVGPDGVAQVAWHDHQASGFQPNLAISNWASRRLTAGPARPSVMAGTMGGTRA
jgi:hypothetical protein